MPENLSFLPYFLTEELFLLPEDRKAKATTTEQASAAAAQTTAPAAIKKEPASQSAPTAQAAVQKETETSSKTGEDQKEAPNPSLIFGKNHKKLLILVEDAAHPVMERQDGLFLKDILKAVQYSFEDVAIVNIAHCRTAADWTAINELPFVQLFSFGVVHPQLPVTSTLAPYELERSGEKHFLMADKLSVIRQDRGRKISLWNLLKQMFV